MSDPTLFLCSSWPDRSAGGSAKSGDHLWPERDNDMRCQHTGHRRNQTLPVDRQELDMPARAGPRRHKDCVSKRREATFPDRPERDAGRPGRLPVQAALRNRGQGHQNGSCDLRCVERLKKTMLNG